jgi:hypothetical protein
LIGIERIDVPAQLKTVDIRADHDPGCRPRNVDVCVGADDCIAEDHAVTARTRDRHFAADGFQRIRASFNVNANVVHGGWR